MLNIYHAPNTRAFRVIWLCEELGVPYELTKVDFSAEYRNTAEWRALSPTGKVPVMHDGEVTMFESCAMTQYVADRYGEGRLQPEPGTAEHALYLQWCWFAEATFARPIGEVVAHKRFYGDNAQDMIMDEMKDRARVCATAVSAALEDREFLLGPAFTAADVMMGYTVMLANMVIPDAITGPLGTYWESVSARDGFKATKAAEQAMS
ncbi:MAG: glutathione S-transferase [Pseudomonadota bacterium]